MRVGLVVVSALATAVAWASEPAKPPRQLPAGGGRLTITEQVTPGSNYCTAEFVRGDTLVRTKVTHAYNAPTGDSSYAGDLLPVYLVVTGAASPKAVPIRTAEGLVKALEAGGYTVSADGKAGEGEASSATVRTYTVVPATKAPPAAPPALSIPK